MVGLSPNVWAMVISTVAVRAHSVVVMGINVVWRMVVCTENTLLGVKVVKACIVARCY